MKTHQDKIGKYLITNERKKVGEYLEGTNSVSQDEAMLQLAQEFASFPVPKDMTIKRGGKTVKLKKGDSDYGNRNPAHQYLGRGRRAKAIQKEQYK